MVIFYPYFLDFFVNRRLLTVEFRCPLSYVRHEALLFKAEMIGRFAGECLGFIIVLYLFLASTFFSKRDKCTPTVIIQIAMEYKLYYSTVLKSFVSFTRSVITRFGAYKDLISPVLFQKSASFIIYNAFKSDGRGNWNSTPVHHFLLANKSKMYL